MPLELSHRARPMAYTLDPMSPAGLEHLRTGLQLKDAGEVGVARGAQAALHFGAHGEPRQAEEPLHDDHRVRVEEALLSSKAKRRGNGNGPKSSTFCAFSIHFPWIFMDFPWIFHGFPLFFMALPRFPWPLGHRNAPPSGHQEAIHRGGRDHMARREEWRHVQRRRGHPTVLEQAAGALRLRIHAEEAVQRALLADGTKMAILSLHSKSFFI